MTKNATAPKKPTWPAVFRAVLTTASISDLPSPDEPQHADDNDEQHRQHEQRNRRAMGHVAGDDADLITFETQDRGGPNRATIGQEKDDGKIGEGEHDAEDQADSHDRKDHRHDDLVVAAPEARAVHDRRVDDVLRHRSDAGQENDDGEGKEAP